MCAKPWGDRAGLLGICRGFRVRFWEVEMAWLTNVWEIRGAPSERLSLYLLASFEEFGLYHGELSKDFEQSVVCVMSVWCVHLIEMWFQKDQGFCCSLLASALLQSFTRQPFLWFKNIYWVLHARHCVGGKELRPCPRGLYPKHIQRYIRGEECSLVQLELSQYWKRPFRESKYEAQIM